MTIAICYRKHQTQFLGQVQLCFIFLPLLLQHVAGGAADAECVVSHQSVISEQALAKLLTFIISEFLLHWHFRLFKEPIKKRLLNLIIVYLPVIAVPEVE